MLFEFNAETSVAGVISLSSLGALPLEKLEPPLELIFIFPGSINHCPVSPFSAFVEISESFISITLPEVSI